MWVKRPSLKTLIVGSSPSMFPMGSGRSCQKLKQLLWVQLMLLDNYPHMVH
ncbi:hypothetical protein Scep_028046 [Stephania cephalantha]|uniref:Uncharacterized protein n=1 Tax=Stephania cephalantha TaxID=152367 RepID=A0AAP0HJ54_9MAGN